MKVMKDFGKDISFLHLDGLMQSKCLLYGQCVPPVSDQGTNPDTLVFLSFYSSRGFIPVLSWSVYSQYH